MKPLNLYRSDGDQPVWEQAEQDAKAAGISLSSHVVAVLRKQQEYSVAIASVIADIHERNEARR